MTKMPHDDQWILAHAKPKGAKEPPISVALAAVNKFLAGKKRVQVYQWPARPKLPRFPSWEDWDDDDDLWGDG